MFNVDFVLMKTGPSIDQSRFQGPLNNNGKNPVYEVVSVSV